jgi:pimeloyl-ACP methyl ester carboxylesterase
VDKVVSQIQKTGETAVPQTPAHILTIGAGATLRRIAYRLRPAQERVQQATHEKRLEEGCNRPGLVWLPGFKSDMVSLKATYLDQWAAETGRALLRFDYSGHGASDGAFENGTIGGWLDDALTAIDHLSHGPQILVGSSMGGWLALLCARAFARRVEQGMQDAERLAGLVLIAPAVDFTERLLWDRLPADIRHKIETEGAWLRPSAYSPEPYVISANLIEEGRRHLLLDGTIRTHCPVHILQGMQDDDVPWRHALTLVERLAGDPVTLTLVKDGDHRLSRAADLERLVQIIDQID